MRKILAAASILLVMITVHLFALSTSKEIKGYYSGTGNSNQTVILSINDGAAPVYQTGTITKSKNFTAEDIENPEEFHVTVFNWSLSGENYGGSVSVGFEFTALMAYVAETGNYYVPVHRFSMELNKNNTIGGNSVQTCLTGYPSNYDGSIVSAGCTNIPGNNTIDTKLAPFSKEKVYASYPYGASEGYSGYSGEEIYRRITYSFTEPPTGQTSWMESGTCILTVSQWDDTSGVFHYKSNVKVEVTIN